MRHGRAHAIQSRIRLDFRRFMRAVFIKRNLPRSKPPPLLPDNAIDLWQKSLKFVLRLLLESTCAAIVSSLASMILFAKINSKFAITNVNVVRWMVLSVAIRMCILQSSITSMASLASDIDCYFAGSYCVQSDDGGAIPVKIRKNIGYGSCLFHSIAASILTNRSVPDFNHDDDAEATVPPSHSEVMGHSSVLRNLAVATLANGVETNAQMVLLQNETVSASSLVNEAAVQFGMSVEEYLSEMKRENVWGGGPELVAISNSLNRQIVLLEAMHGNDNLHDDNKTTHLKVRARLGPQTTIRPIYILSTNQRFPMHYGKASNNHFLAVVPSRAF